MQFKQLAVTDNAGGQLNSGLSAVATTLTLKSGEGAEFPTTYTGTTTSGGDGTTLNKTSIGSSGIAVGDFIENTTDGSHAYVVTVSTNSLTTTQLKGGSDNTWQNADAYRVNAFVVTVGKKSTAGAWTSWEKILIGSRSGDTLTVATSGRGYSGTSAAVWDADDYVELLNTKEIFLGVHAAIAELNTDKADMSTVTALFNARNVKDEVVCATTAAGTLATSFANGQVVDGITLVTGDRILIKNQAASTENGIYVVAASGAPARATDADLGSELVNAIVAIQKGTSNADLLFICTSDSPITIGASNITWSQVGGSALSKASTVEMLARVEDTKYATAAKVNDAIDGNVRYVRETYTVEPGFSVTQNDGVSINGAGKIVSGTGQVIGNAPAAFTANTIDTTYTAHHACLLDATHIVITYYETVAAKNYVIAGLISGGSITYGSPVQLTATTLNCARIVALDSTHFVVTYGGSVTTAYFTCGSVAGTVITLGSEVTKTGCTGLGSSQGHQLRMLDSTHFLLAYYNGGGGQFGAVVGSVSGTTITLGALVLTSNAALNGAMAGYQPYCVALTSTLFVIGMSDNSGTTVSFYAATISGVTITMGSVQTTTNLGGSTRPVIYALDATHFLAASYATGTKKVIVGSISGTTITFGSTATFTNTCSNAIAILSATSFVAMTYDGSSYMHAQAGTISGTTITLGTDILIDSETTYSAGNQVLALAISSSNAIFVNCGTSFVARAHTVSVSGTTCSIGNSEKVGTIATGGESFDPYFLGLISTGSALLVYAKSAIVVSAANTKIIGAAVASAVGGATVAVGVDGLCDGLASLVAGAKYYHSAAGTLNTTPSFYPFGTAYSTTGIKIDRTLPNTSALVSVAITSSPQTIRNSYPGQMALSITAGTVSAVAISRDGTTFYQTAAATNTIVELAPGDYAKVTYSSNPTLFFIPR